MHTRTGDSSANGSRSSVGSVVTAPVLPTGEQFAPIPGVAGACDADVVAVIVPANVAPSANGMGE